MDDKDQLILLGEIKGSLAALLEEVKTLRKDLKKQDEKIAEMEKKLNIAAGVILAVSTVFSFIINTLSKKIGLT